MSRIINSFNKISTNISKVVNGSASANNKGINRLVNGSQQEIGEYIVFRGGLKHLITETFFRNKLNSYLEAIKMGEIEKATTIYKHVPKSLQQTFHEYAGLDTLFINGKGAKYCDKLSQFRQAVSDTTFNLKRKLFDTFFPDKLNLFKESLAEGDLDNALAIYKKVPKILRRAFKECADVDDMHKVQPININFPTVKTPPKTKLDDSSQDSLVNAIVEMYRTEGVSDDKISKMLNVKFNGAPFEDRFYRFIGESELDELLLGKNVTSTRPCHKGVITDVTTNPNYSKINTHGKYRVAFKDKPEFNPYTQGKHRILEKELADEEFQLLGGYSLDDVERIEQKDAEGIFRTIWSDKQ